MCIQNLLLGRLGTNRNYIQGKLCHFSLILFFPKITDVLLWLVATVPLLHPFFFSLFTAFISLSFLLVLHNYFLCTSSLVLFASYHLSYSPLFCTVFLSSAPFMPYLHLFYYWFSTLFHLLKSSRAIPLCFYFSFSFFKPLSTFSTFLPSADSST